MTAKIKAKHTLIDDTSIRELLHYYELENVNQCRFLTRGLNDTYIIKDADSAYIFRVYRHNWRNESAILYELDALQHLQKQNYPVSFPIRKKDGSFLCEMEAPEGLRYGVLFSYANGERPKISEDHSMLIGKALGKMHAMTDTF